MFLAGVALFALTSLAGGLAQNPGMLILFRALQGLGGALLAPAALSLVLTTFQEGQERNRALGIWSMVAAGGGAVGLLLGGVLTQYINWRWIFFINVPIAALVLISAMKYVPHGKSQGKKRLDIAGAVTITGSLMSMVYALAKAPDLGWTNRSTLGMFGLAAALLVAFIVNELRVRDPLMPLGIFKRRNVSGGSLIQLLMPASMFGFFFYLSIYLQQILHYSPTKTGAADLPFTFMIILVAAVLSKRMAKMNVKALLTIAPLIVAASLVYFGRIPVHAHYLTDILPGIILMAGGMAVVFVTNTMVTTSGVSHEESGLVSGLLNTGQQVGGAIGLAILSVVSTAATKSNMVAAHGNPAHEPQALVYGFQRGFLAAIGFAVASSLAAAFVLKMHKPTAGDIAQEPETEAEALAAVPGV